MGSVKKDAVIDGSRIAAGDVVLGLASSGVHSNGFSLVRKVLEVSGTSLHDAAPWAGAAGSVGLELLVPTRLYVTDVLKLIAAADVKVHWAVEFVRFLRRDGLLHEPLALLSTVRRGLPEGRLR